MTALTTRTANLPLSPQSLAEAMDFAKTLGRSTLVPKEFIGKPENILIAVLWGKEIGMSPVQSLQSIAVINGRPTIWGDAAIGLARAHPDCESIMEGVDGDGEQAKGWCEVKRRRQPAQRREFSVADARKAGLWGKPGPWQQYPKRMLQLRARGFALRDVLPDALKGIITREEANDYPTVDAVAEPAAAPAAATSQTQAIEQSRADMVAEGLAIEVKFPNGAARVYGDRDGAWSAIAKAAERCESLSQIDTLESDNAGLLDPMQFRDGAKAASFEMAAEALATRRTEMQPPASADDFLADPAPTENMSHAELMTMADEESQRGVRRSGGR